MYLQLLCEVVFGVRFELKGEKLVRYHGFLGLDGAFLGFPARIKGTKEACFAHNS